MPASLALAQPTTVMPFSLCRSFVEDRLWTNIISEPYPDGRTQGRVQVGQPRRSWTITQRLSFTQYNTLHTFYNARKGMLEPFYWYPLQTDYDATGTSLTGRYTVRFNGSLSAEYLPGKQTLNIQLIEVA